MASYPATILSHSPALYLKENETSGTTLVDSSGNSHNATTSGSWAVDATAPAGGGINWNGGFASVADHADLKPSVLTLEIWVKTDGTGDRGLMVKSSSGSLNDGYGWYVLSGGVRLRFYINNYNGPGQFVEIGPSVGGWNDGAWTHLVGTFDGTDIKAYINGVLDDTQPYSSSISHSSSALLVASYPSSSAFPGSTETAVLYPTVLTALEVAALYSAATNPTVEAGTGVITINGVGATVNVPVVAGTGVITVTGVAATLNLVAGTGVITVHGVGATLQTVLLADTGVITVHGVAASVVIVSAWPTPGAVGTLTVLWDPNRTYVSTDDITLTLLVNSTGDFDLTLLDETLAPVDLTGGTVTWDVMLSGTPVIEDLACAVVGSAVNGTVHVPAYATPLTADSTYLARATLTVAPDAYPYPAHGIEVRT